MKATVYSEYGSPDVLSLKEVKKPLPSKHEVLVKVHSSSLNYGNLLLLKGEPFIARFVFGLLKPKYSIPGADLAGKVVVVGKDVTQFKEGDEVFGDLSNFGWGAFAEYVCVHESALVLKPINLSFDEAAAVPMAAMTALQALRKGNIQKGQKVMIHGASGGVGTFAVQIAKALGAEVTGICSSRNVQLLQSIGTDHIIDYQKEHFSHKKDKYDIILGVNGFQPITVYKKALKPKGIFIHVGGSGKQLFRTILNGPWSSLLENKKVMSLLQKSSQEDLVYIKELLETKKILPIIDKKYPLQDISEAFTYFAQGHAQGKVVITISSN